MKRLLITLNICFSALTFAQHKSVLFIGNSYTGVNNLPELVYNFALANGDTLVYDSNTPGGYTFNLHRTNATTLSKIASRNWDYVVLQEQSQIPALPEAITGEDYSPPHAMELNEIIKANDSCTKVIFYMTWGRKFGDASFCGEYPPVCTYTGMQDELRNTYLEMTIENEARVAPAGMGWKAVIDDDPSIELYSGDGSHPNINGSYLTACIMYATIYQKSPVGTSFISTLEADLATYLQEKAHAIVFDSLATWRIGIGDLTADFNYTNTDLTYTFENSSENESSRVWDIDGNLYLEENPTHTFDEDGIYTATLTTFNGCDTVEHTETIFVGSAALNKYENDLIIFPNPTNETLFIRGLSGEPKQAVLYDLAGGIRGVYALTNTGEIDLSGIRPGIYFIKIDDSFYKFVKN